MNIYWVYIALRGRNWASFMYFSHWRENDISDIAEQLQGHNSCRKFVVAHIWYINCHVSATLPGLICTSLGLSSDCLIHSQGCSPLTHFILPFHHVLCSLSSISMTSIVMPESLDMWMLHTWVLLQEQTLRCPILVCYFACIRFTVWSHRLTLLDHQQCGTRMWNN